MFRRSMLGALACALVLAACGGSDDAAPVSTPVATAGPQKIIIDSDYNTMSDDGQLGVMAVQLQKQGLVKVMGISVVSGNQWMLQGQSDALKAMERLGVGQQIGVYAGETLPLDHDYTAVQADLAVPGAAGDGYLGAWGASLTPTTQAQLVAPPDGFATSTTVQAKSAVDFIVDTVKANPNEITILAVGPLTNIAKATARNPEIVPLIKQIIYMGGAVHVPGNTTSRAEFNIWFDPLAAQQVMRLPIPGVMVSLDVTDTVLLDEANYQRVAHPAGPTGPQTIVESLFQKTIGLGFNGLHGFENDPNFTINIWDSLTIAYLMDPTLATQTSQEYIDVDTTVGINDGKTTGYVAPPDGLPLQKLTVVRAFDNARFFDLYADLLTRPVPVTLTN